MRSFFRRSRPHPARRNFLTFFRPLRVEPLESRLALTILTVNSLADGPVDFTDSTVTLREAIEAANTDVAVSPGGPTGSGNDEVRFQAGLSGEIALITDLNIESNLTIAGPGAHLLSIRGASFSRVFNVDDGVASQRTITISGLTITGGSLQSPGGFVIIQDGGGILNAENLTIQNCAITGNFANGNGGGIFNTGTLTVQNSVISGNSVSKDGGGIANSGPMTVQNSTISGNLAKGFGGGIEMSVDYLLTVQNSTITQNRADTDNDGVVLGGGGIAVGPSTTTITPVLHNTIIADNFSGSGTTTESNIATGGSDLFSGTHNLIGTGESGGLTNGVNGNQVGVTDPMLGPLADNGGPTKTHAILGGSPALNAGINAQAPSFSNTDQRGAGFARIAGGTVDIGAFEAPPPITVIVDTEVDEADGNEGPGDLSLREAINRINENAAGGSISFATGFFNTPRMIVLKSNLGQLTISGDLTITGPGANLLNVNGDVNSRVFNVTDFADTVRSVTISGLTIAGGSALLGAGILNRENLTILRCTITQNTAFEDVAFEVGGGGIFNTGSLTVNSSTISGNLTQAGGAGIKSVDGTLTLQSSTISGNLAQASGGGIESVGGPLTVVNSTISGNGATKNGGGIFASGGLTGRNSTITQNQADSDRNGSGVGGGIRLEDFTATLHNTIVAGNTSFLADKDGNSIIRADNISAGNATVTSSSTNNLIGTGGSGGLSNGTNGNQVGVSTANLGTLAENGGPTKTHALLEGSTAIDRGNNTQTQASLTLDQRGFARIFNDTVDIGAFEVQPEFPWHNFENPLDVNGGPNNAPDEHISAGDALAIINYINAFDAGAVPADAELGQPYGFLDTTKDNSVAPADALEIINAINSGQGGEGEGVAGRGSPDPASPEASDLLTLLALDIATPRRKK